MHPKIFTIMQNIENKIIQALSTGNDKLNYKQIAAKINVYDKAGREEVKRIIDKFVNTKILLKSGRENIG